MGSNNKGKKLLENFESRKEGAERILREICRETGLSELLGGESTWAIVGGAVRDSLLAPDPYTKPFFSLWPDVDVAIAHPEFDGDKDLSQIEDTRLSVRRNSYGGWKVSFDDVGELDVWKAKLGSAKQTNAKRWLQYLNRVDFAINAVAFLWPECRIAIHPLWQESVENSAIVRLSHKVMMEHLQPIRAIALAVKLEQTTKVQFELDEDILTSLKKLITCGDELVIREALIYLLQKVSSTRWPRPVLDRFLEETVSVANEFRFFQIFEALFEEDIIRCAKPKVRASGTPRHSRRQPRLFPRKPLR